MKQKKYTKRALCMSLLSMLLCLSMLIGSTFAWFTDSVTSGKNKIVAGNLDVELLHKGAHDEAFVAVNEETKLFLDKDGKEIKWEPGVVAYEQFNIKNVGSLALKYILSLVIDEEETTHVDDGKTLADVIKLGFIDMDATKELPATLDRDTLIKAVEGDGMLKDFETDKGFTEAGDGKLEKDAETGTFTVVLYWEPSEVDDNYNLKNGKQTDEEKAGDTEKTELTIGFETRLYATQLESESDSFGNDYDHDAALPTLTASGLKNTLETLTGSEGHISMQLGENMDLEGNGILLPNGADVEIDGDGKTVTVEHSAFNNYDGLEGINEGKLSFRNMTFKGADKTLDGQFAVVVGFDSEVEVVFENCKFEDLYAAVCANPTKDDGKVTNIKFVNCEFTNVNYGVSIDPDTLPGTYNVTFENCTMNGTKYSEFNNGDMALELNAPMDVTESNGMEVKNGSELTVDGNGQTVTLSHSAFNNYEEGTLEGISEGKLNFKNMTFEGESGARSGKFAVVLGFESEVDAVFENCTFKHLYDAVYVNPTEGNTVSHITFINCKFEDIEAAAVGIDEHTKQGSCIVTFDGCTMGGVKYSEFDNGDINVKGNVNITLDDKGMNTTTMGSTARPQDGIDVTPGSDVTVDGKNQTVTLDHTAFNHFDSTEGITEGTLTFKNVEFKGKTDNAKNGYVTVLGFGSTANVVFENCTFTDMFSAVYVNDGATGSVTFKDCTFTNCAYACGMGPNMIEAKNDGSFKVTFEGTKNLGDAQECGWEM